jgi:hypothetical protein
VKTNIHYLVVLDGICTCASLSFVDEFEVAEMKV